MAITGLNVQGLDITQINRKMEEYLAHHFDECVVVADGNGIFAEVYRLAYDEIDHLLVQPECMQLFNGNEWFMGASGLFETSGLDNGEKETYTAMLVLDENQAQALYLYISKWGATTQEEVNTLVKNFTKGGKCNVCS